MTKDYQEDDGRDSMTGKWVDGIPVKRHKSGGPPLATYIILVFIAAIISPPVIWAWRWALGVL